MHLNNFPLTSCQVFFCVLSTVHIPYAIDRLSMSITSFVCRVTLSKLECSHILGAVLIRHAVLQHRNTHCTGKRVSMLVVDVICDGLGLFLYVSSLCGLQYAIFNNSVVINSNFTNRVMRIAYVPRDKE